MTTILKKILQKRSKNAGLLSILFVFLIVLMIFLVIINISDIFSSLITSEKSIFLNDKIEQASYNAYCVSAGDFASENDAITACSQVAREGGMGIVHKRGEYFALAGIYPTLIEAQEVQKNLRENNCDAKVVRLEVRSISKDYKGKNKELIAECLQSFRQNFLSLYEDCLNFDKNFTTESALKGKLAQFWTQNNDLIKKLSKTKTNISDEEKSFLISKMSNVSLFIEVPLLFSGERLQLSSLLKQTCYHIVLENMTLAESF